MPYILLPSGDGGKKQGLDDFLAAHLSNGGTRDNFKDALLSHAVNELPAQLTPHESRYAETPHGLVWNKPAGEEGKTVAVALTNFTARILADLTEDDGAVKRSLFTIEATLNGRTRRFDVPAREFPSLQWATEHLGSKAIVYPGQSIREHTRVAIQMLSDPTRQHVRTHVGWVRREGSRTWGYCHAGGVIGGEKAQEGGEEPVSVRCGEGLAKYLLPEPPQGEALKAAVHASLRLLTLSKERIAFPLLSGVYRAPLGSCDFSIFLAGATGSFKTEAAALAQQHFGAGMNARNLPADWSSTDNALEGLAFTAKDALLVIDEYVPGRDPRLTAKVDRVLRAQGNSAGRGRMNADSSLRPTKHPRGLILSTGEDVPPGHSLRARSMVIEVVRGDKVRRGDIDPDALTCCQRDAAAGLYAQAMAGYLSYLAPQYEQVQSSLQQGVIDLRAQAAKELPGVHQRTPDIVASLATGLKFFLKFASVHCGAITREEADALFRKGWGALIACAKKQMAHHADADPARRFCALLSSALASGKAHVQKSDGTAPANPLAWGWQRIQQHSGFETEWRAQGDAIGWVDGEDLYLDPQAAYNCARRIAGEGSAEALSVSLPTLNKRLNEKGLLQTTDRKRQTLTVRQTRAGARHSVLHLRAVSLVCQEPDQPAQPDHEGGS